MVVDNSKFIHFLLWKSRSGTPRGGGLICNGCIFNSLDCKLKKSEKRHMISRWVPSGSDYQSTISRLQERQREACLRLLYAQASERSFVVNLLHKYSG